MALLVSLGLASCGGGGGGGGAGSGSGSDGNNSDDWLIPVSQVVDGGPG